MLPDSIVNAEMVNNFLKSKNISFQWVIHTYRQKSPRFASRKATFFNKGLAGDSRQKCIQRAQKSSLARRVHNTIPADKNKKQLPHIGERRTPVETPLYVLLSQQDALERQMGVVAHNVANANTTGFKGQDVMFEEFLKGATPRSAAHYVLDRATIRNTAQGSLQKTDNTLDFAISGPGYFSVQTPQGTQYTRQGSFQLDAEGNLVTPDGFKVLSAEGSPITIPAEAKQLSVGNDGTISTELGNQGRLQPVMFDNQQELEETYGGLYTTTAAAQPDNVSTINQGMVESSNVSPVVEMTRVIEISRAYQRTLNLIQSENERMRNAIQKLGQPI
jgi:flagellar basal-body rod protein FlgF